jgi:hypothetical protein
MACLDRDAAVAAIGVLLWLLPTSSKQQSANGNETGYERLDWRLNIIF